MISSRIFKERDDVVFSIGRFICAVAFMALLLQGCATVGPDYIPPEPEVPDRWERELVKGVAEGRAGLQTWWTVFNDPVLNELM